MFTNYENMKDNRKCKNWGGVGDMGNPRPTAMSTFDRAHMTSYSTLIHCG